MKVLRHVLLAIVLWIQTLSASAQWYAVFINGYNQAAMPVALIDSLKLAAPCSFNVFTSGRSLLAEADSMAFKTHVPDTITISYHDKEVHVFNPCLDQYQIQTEGTQVYVTSLGKQPFSCRATGSCKDGRLIIDADTTMTLILDSLCLSSQTGSVLYLRQNQKVIIDLSNSSCLSDATVYHPKDTTDISNACLYARGPLTFKGNGELGVSGNYRHGVFSSKSVTMKDGHIFINNAVKDGIHCDKFTMQGGTLQLSVLNDAAKGIKTKKDLTLEGGQIEGEAWGNLTVTEGDASYCTLLKSDGMMTVTDGKLSLKHHGNCGRCISVDNNLTVTGGMLNLECYGDGGKYFTVENDSDYYTPKCITVDDSIFVKGGITTCTSTGLGGKGIVAEKYLAIGDSANLQDIKHPTVSIETRGECIVNNVDEDLRFGCPKGIKSDSLLVIYSGDITVRTAGMGGEGIECNKNMFVYGGKLECHTFDDGINVADSIEIAGGLVYCNSVDNDGIDSNGTICISGGIVASANQHKPNESLDSESGTYFRGGIVFGIGSGHVDPAEASLPCYSTPFNESDEGIRSRGLILTEGKFIYIQRGDEIIMAMRNDNKAFRSFVTVMSPAFNDSEQLFIVQGDCPTDVQQSFFDNSLVFGGTANNPFVITDIQVQTIKPNAYETTY